jgi:dihydrofolate reductase
MRKVILSMMVSADGYMEGPGHDIGWHIWDDEMSAYMLDFFKTTDLFLYGRVSYELMLGYWPAEKGIFADVMNDMPKLVFSRTLEKTTWNSRLVKDNIAGEIKQLKRQPGKDMVLFAGADIATAFILDDLIDEYRLIVNPVVLGAGTPYFKGVREPFKLHLTGAQKFNCGNVLLRYIPIRK